MDESKIGELIKVRFAVEEDGGAEWPWAEVVSIESPLRITAKLKNDLVSVDFDCGEILPFVLNNGHWEYEFNSSYDNAGGCTSCKSTDRRAGPMLHDEAWAKIADENEMLCERCVKERFVERKVPIRFDDLRPCLFNLFGHPDSWFEVFRRLDPDARISDEWKEVFKDAIECGKRGDPRFEKMIGDLTALAGGQ